MAGHSLQLPTIQNWSCHSCSNCCRQHVIEVTDEERRRILEQQWTDEDGVPADTPQVVWHAGPPWNKRYRLGNQSDGACVFLNEKGLCRIHAKFGEEAKPLPCRIYPYAFHPAGKKVAVSLRFSCPSVVFNRGRSVGEQQRELKKVAEAIVPEGVTRLPAPRLAPGEQLDWPDFQRFLSALDKTLADPQTPLTVKLLRALFWVRLVEQARFDTVLGPRLDEFLQLIVTAAEDEIPAVPSAMNEPGRIGRMQFRMLVAQYARKDTLADLKAGIGGRWRLFKAAVRFARGTGNVPPLQDLFKAIPFAALEAPFGPLPGQAEEILTRYFRIKVQGIHFCGRAYYGLDFVEGFYSLALIYPSMLWLARWLAAGEGRSKLDTDDVARAVTIADHYHAYAPSFGTRTFRWRVRILAGLKEIEKLCCWYSR